MTRSPVRVQFPPGMIDGRPFGVVSASEFTARYGLTGVALQAAIDAAHAAGARYVVVPKVAAGYTIDPSVGAVRIRTGIEFDGGGNTFTRTGSNTTARMFENYDYASDGEDAGIAFRNAVLVGTGDTVGVSDQGHALGFYGVNGLTIENVETRATNGDGLALRKVAGVCTIRDVTIGDYGRNGFSPSGVLDGYVENLHVTGSPISGANPGIGIDCEPDVAGETVYIKWVGVSAETFTMADLVNVEGATFGVDGVFNACHFGSDTGTVYLPFRIVSTNATVARKLIIGRDTVFSSAYAEAAGHALVQIENVSNVHVSGTARDTGAGTNNKALMLEGVVNDLKVDAFENDGAAFSVFVFVAGTDIVRDAIIRNSILPGRCYLRDVQDSVFLNNPVLSTVELRHADCTGNTFAGNGPITWVEDGGLKSAQTIGLNGAAQAADVGADSTVNAMRTALRAAGLMA